ncbi:Monocarboxylate transporter 12, partial [Stegodyphus mimosarum]
MKRTGPDSLNSWIIAVACCFINMMMYGMARLSGVLFVASVPRFSVGREEASFPYTFANFMRNTSGPLVGYLGHKYGVRLVTTSGCLLGAIGIAACYFAESIPIVTVLWGTLFGLGFGLGNILLPVAINQYFDKNRATASGISFSGACLGSFALPPIVEILLNTYGLSGTYLFLAGFVLNCVPAALLLKKPNFVITTAKSSQLKSVEEEKQSIVAGKKVKLYTVENNSDNLIPVQEKNVSIHGANVKELQQSPDAYDISDQQNKNENPVVAYDERIKRLSTQTLLSDYSIHMSTSEALKFDEIIKKSKERRPVDPANLECEVSSTDSQNLDFERDELFRKNSQLSFCSANRNTKVNLADSYFRTLRSLSMDSVLPSIKNNSDFRPTNSYNEAYDNSSYQNDFDEGLREYVTPQKSLYETSTSFTPTILSDSENSEEKSALKSFSIIFDPIFVLIAITNAIYCFTFVCMITVIVDFARDVGIGTSNEKYVLMSLSIGDLIGRLFLGRITDEGYMTKTGFATFCFICQGIATTAVAFSSGFAMLISIVAFYGLSEAGLILIFPLIVAEFIEEDKQTVAIPSSNFLSGPLCLAVAPLIGYFRDDVGSYSYIFFGIGVISVICGLAWLLAPCIAKCRKSTRD